MLLFWASNALKLMSALLQDTGVFGASAAVMPKALPVTSLNLVWPPLMWPAIFSDCAKLKMDQTVDKCLEGIDSCSKAGQRPSDFDEL